MEIGLNGQPGQSAKKTKIHLGLKNDPELVTIQLLSMGDLAMAPIIKTCMILMKLKHKKKLALHNMAIGQSGVLGQIVAQTMMKMSGGKREVDLALIQYQNMEEMFVKETRMIKNPVLQVQIFSFIVRIKQSWNLGIANKFSHPFTVEEIASYGDIPISSSVLSFERSQL